MLSLLDKKIVIKKEFTSKAGKTKDLYWANQESRAKEVMKLIPDQQEMEEAQRELYALRRVDTEIAKEMTILHQQLSNDEIHAQLRENGDKKLLKSRRKSHLFAPASSRAKSVHNSH
jgi:hypothetical protein